VVFDFRVPLQIYDKCEEDVLRLGNYEDAVERVAPIAVDVFDVSIDNCGTKQVFGRNGRNMGPIPFFPEGAIP